MTLTVAFAVMCASTALIPPFSGSVWFTAGLGATVTVAAVGTLSRLRILPPVVCLLISVAGLLLYLNLAFEAHSSFCWVVPTRASVIGLGDLVRNGFSDAHTYSPPAPTVPPLVFLAAAGIGITAVLTDLIAVRLRSTAMAGLPLLVLFTVPETINVHRSSLTTCLIFIISTGGYLAMLSADGREQIRVWGRLVSLWRTDTPQAATPQAAAASADGAAADGADPGGGSGGKHRQRSAISPFRGPDTRSLAAAGRRVGFASIVLALCAPLLVPGLHAARVASDNLVFGGAGGSGGGAAIPPLLSEISAELEDSHPHVVMTYVTNDPHPGYLQQEVRDTLTANAGWEEPFRTQAVTLYPIPSQLQAQAPGLASVGSPVTTKITVVKGGSSPTPTFNLLPTPFPPTRVSPPPGTWLYDPSTLMVGTENASMDDVTYTVQSREVYPTKAQLEKATTPVGMGQYLLLPASYRQSADLLALARKITKGDANDFDKAFSIQNYLSSTGGFTYNTAAPEIDDVSELLAYLQTTKSGDCVQSAYAMAVMLRLLGIPSRLVLGFTQGTETTPGHYAVKDTDAHAWPEAFFAGYGWIQFEPVAPGGGGTAGTGAFSQTQSSTSNSTSAGQPGSTSTTGTGSTVNRRHLLVPGSGPEQPGIVSILPLSKPVAKTPWTALALAILAALALACGIIAMVAPLGHRALSGRQDDRGRRRRPNAGPLLLIVVGGGVVAFALDRVLTRTSGLDLGSGWANVGIAFGIAFGAVCVVALTVPAVCRAVLRRLRWMRAADDAGRAHTAWVELRADLADYGLAPLPSESPRALAGRITTGLALAEPAAEAVGRIAMAEERASYSARPAESETLHQDSTAARRGIAAAAGRGARWRARIFPASMMTAFADAAGRIPQTWAAWRLRLPLAPSRR
jgi:transglutaminase-like putative cysteine protease